MQPVSHKHTRQTYDNDDDIHVDVEEEDSQMVVDEDARFLPEPMTQYTGDGDFSTLSRNSSAPRKPPHSGPSARKIDTTSRDKLKKLSKKFKRANVFTDDEGDYDDAGDHAMDGEVPDDEFAPSPAQEPKGKTARKGSALGGGKGKSKIGKDEKVISFKDERKLPVKEESPVTTGSKRSHLSSDAEATIDPTNAKPGSPISDHTQANTLVDPVVANERDNEPAPKKRKLPTIKKIKTAGSANSTPGPSAKHGQGPMEELKEKEKDLSGGSTLPPLPASLPRKPAATAGNADLDLTNKDVYKQLFSQGNAPPRSGVKEKEERVRQLSKMREEARAKRAEEARTSFDLQAQHDKIVQFTKRLEGRRSPAVWPNTLAAKFKAELEEKARLEGRARIVQDHRHHHRQSGHQNGWTT